MLRIKSQFRILTPLRRARSQADTCTRQRAQSSPRLHWTGPPRTDLGARSSVVGGLVAVTLLVVGNDTPRGFLIRHPARS